MVNIYEFVKFRSLLFLGQSPMAAELPEEVSHDA